MSKYYKAEDVINAIEDKIAEYIPTLYGRYAEIPLELRMAIEHLPTIEVSEDCISREELLKVFGLSEKSRKYGGDHSGYQTLMLYEIQDIIEDAPSVVPTDKCKVCQQYDMGYDDGRLDMLQKLSDTLKLSEDNK